MEFHYSKIKIWSLQFANVILLIVGLVFCITYTFPHSDWILIYGCAGILIATINLAKTAPMLFKTGPQVIINSHGIQDKRQKTGLIAWDNIRAIDIKAVYFRGFKSYSYLIIESQNPESYRSRISQAHIEDSDENSPFAISFRLLKPSIKEATEFIASHHPTIKIRNFD
jgi:hypothetical protein